MPDRWLLVLLALVACLPAARTADGKGTISLEKIPVTRRVEGRVTLEYVDGNQRIKNKLAFTEVTDGQTQRSKVSIGHVSYEPKTYYTRGKTVMVLNSMSKRCEVLPEGTRLLPELDFFLRYSYTDQELVDGLARLKNNCNSPLAVLLLHSGDLANYDHSETHRGVQCSVFRSSYKRSSSEESVKLDIFVPEITLGQNTKMPFFTMRETVEGLSKSNSLAKFGTAITIDFFYIEEIDKSDPHKAALLEDELSLPLAKGCSEFLQPIQPNVPDFQSFMMSYVKASTSELVSLAYDHEFGYLREELHGQSVKIWDLNEDLLYHTDRSMFGRMQDSDTNEIALQPCSVISFEDRPSPYKQPSASDANKAGQGKADQVLRRPYETAGSSLDVLRFLGAGSVYHMGRSTCHDLPCLVFETILDSPPKIFQIDIQETQVNDEAYEYIVQYYVFETANKDLVKTASEANVGQPITMDRFWPAKINLYVRHKETGWVYLQESLEVQDFHWGLYGWQGKPSELFMMPDCFENEDEQLKIELALDMKETTPNRRQNILANHKYKLELDLQTNLFKRFEMSRLHLVEYRLALQRHNLLATMVISDRKEDKKLSYFGEGELPSPDSYKGHRMQLTSRTATSSVDDCVMSGSHLDGVSMVIFCPGVANDLRPSCTVVYDEPEPVIKSVGRTKNKGITGADSARAPCKVFRFETIEPPKAATQDVDRLKQLLENHHFTFSLKESVVQTDPANASEQEETVEISIEDFDVTREQRMLLISNYRFLVPDAKADEANEDTPEQAIEPLVRHFPSVNYDTMGDCSRVCNLDSSCRSFSFCAEKSNATKADTEPKCILSSLDLRKSNVELQLVQATLDKNLQMVVRGGIPDARGAFSSNASEYKIGLKSGCNIHERDPLNMFTRTEEFLRISQTFANQFPVVSSATACARRVIELEGTDEKHYGATFAYCAHTGTCLRDESMFQDVKGANSDSISEEEDPANNPKELTCQLFRKRYQTYFHVSPLVVKRAAKMPGAVEQKELEKKRVLSGGIMQSELPLSTVEECARACWDVLGHVCVSFDFCSPQACIINMAGDLDGSPLGARYDPTSIEYESRQGCLEYKRDLKWDQLRRDHLLGNHKLLEINPEADRTPYGSWIANFLLLCAILVLFDVGLVVGRNFNDRWENTSGTRRSLLGDVTSGGLAQFFRTSVNSNTGGNAARSAERMSSQSKFNIENEIYEDANAIRMDEIGRNGHAPSPPAGESDHERLQTLSERDEEVVGDLMQRDEPKPAPRRPNYIDVPDLL